MLSDRERQLLDQLERTLSDDDPLLAATLTSGRRPRFGLLRHAPSMILLGLALALTVIGLIRGWGVLVAEGVAVMLAGAAWRVCQARTARALPRRVGTRLRRRFGGDARPPKGTPLT
jgi:Protein of unknown function (DUF3040)